MKTIFYLFFSLLLVVANAQSTVSVNTQKSELKWTGNKIVGSHYGKVFLQSGKFIVKNNILTGGEFVINMNSITCDDIKDEESNQKLIGHLKNDDFFSVDKHPTSTLKITKVQKLAKKPNSYTITANLTIKGITHSISFPATFSKSGKKYVATADIEIDRTKWNIRYGSASFFDNLGNKAIKNEIKFQIQLESL